MPPNPGGNLYELTAWQTLYTGGRACLLRPAGFPVGFRGCPFCRSARSHSRREKNGPRAGARMGHRGDRYMCCARHKKGGTKTVPQCICGVGVVIPRRVVPLLYSRISKLSSHKIFFVDKSKPYTHNIGVGSFHTLAHLPTFTVFMR
jgi:hypothetical protein